MEFGYGQLAERVVEWAVSYGQTDRIVSIDLETKVPSPDDFLTNETVLSFALARRVGNEIMSKLFVLEDESPQAQQALFSSVNQEIERIRPLVIIGYNVTGYDMPLLRIKLRNLPVPFWAIIDMVERSFALDMKHPIKFELAKHDGSSPKVRSLEDVVNHVRFSHLPLRRTKNLLNGLDKTEKGAKIYYMWRKNQADFERYALGDVVDVLTLFEELFVKKLLSATAKAK